MTEVGGNLWDYENQSYCVIGITTNGTVKKNGECVMGRGCAAEAKRKFPEVPAIIGAGIRANGNLPLYIPRLNGRPDIFTFPVKHNWWERADLELIELSARGWRETCRHSNKTFVLPRPGCGNGGRDWQKEVRPILVDILPDNVHVISFFREEK